MSNDRNRKKLMLSLFLMTLLMTIFLSSPDIAAQKEASEKAMQRKIKDVPPVLLVYYHMFSGRLKEPKGIFYDRAKDEIYCADTGNGLIGIYNMDGMELFLFGSKGVINEPYNVMVDPEGDIYVIDLEIGKVKVFNYRGEFRRFFDFSQSPAPEPKPVAMNVDREGKLYFLDSSIPRVLIFTMDGRFLRSFGEKGIGKGKLSSPSDIAIDDAGNIYITDRVGMPVQVFNPEGKFINGWGEHDVGSQNFSFPAGIAIDRDGRIFVADTLRQDIKVFDADGNFLINFGGFGFEPGEVAYPSDVTIDGQGRIWVTEKIGSRIQVFCIEEQ
ncbi:MAG: 6-bladed beta-propeller [Acidobacteriota bacterium]